MNSVNFETGMKFHQSAREMQQVKDYCNQLCREYGLSVTESKADPFRIPTWKRRLTDHIKEAMEQSRTQQEFVAYMNAYGYDVKRSGCSSSIPPKAAACRSWKSER